MDKIQDNLNNIIDGEFVSEEKTQTIFGTTMARASVVQSLFESEISKDYKKENITNLHFYIKLDKSKQKIAKTILIYALENKNKIDQNIKKHISDNNIKRIPKTDLSILRMAVAEIFSEIDTPIGVIVNESVKLADIFGSDTSKNFINGVLSSMVR
ncbi:MAG: transcription antitermination factor NusB [Chloroflexota bacterium]|jgi:N utilization substance protein B|nr:transcription antitermination factor NusB [Chloroflexota bacterium]